MISSDDISIISEGLSVCESCGGCHSWWCTWRVKAERCRWNIYNTQDHHSQCSSLNRTFLTVVIGRFCQITVKLEAFSSLLHLLCCSPHFPFLWSFFNLRNFLPSLRLSLLFTLRVPVRTELQSNTAPLPPCCGSAPAVYSVNENTCNAKLRTSPWQPCWDEGEAERKSEEKEGDW